MRKQFFVYIMASDNQTLYVGVTSHLTQRVAQHKAGTVAGFSARYRTKKLVYFEEHASADDAFAREKQLKKWRREKKLGLIRTTNPSLDDLASGWL